MSTNPVFERFRSLTENEFRRDVLVPLLTRTQDVFQVTDVHGTNERGLDVVFCTVTAIRKTWYGLQLKRGDIAGGGSGRQTVKEIIDQLELASDFEHHVATPPPGKYTMDRFIVAASGRISQTAREEITGRLKPMPVDFWDLTEIVRRARDSFPELLQIADAELVTYLTKLRQDCQVLDALDQVPGVAERTLSDVFVESQLRKRIDPRLGGDDQRAPTAVVSLALRKRDSSAVVIGEQNEGKTAILRMNAIAQVNELLEGTEESDRLRIPVPVRAAALLESRSVRASIAKAFRDRGAPRHAQDIDAGGPLNRYLVLLDGFSELPTQRAKRRCAEYVVEAEEQDGAIFIIAGRPDDFLRPEYFDSASHYNIPPLNASEVRTLVRHWTKDAVKVQDVAERLIERVRDALQLPGSPIPAIIGVMLYEKEQRFITNTADAVDRYMQIRLGRYAREMGIAVEVNWARKQDLLGEIAFAMVEEGRDSVTYDQAKTAMSAIYERLGEADMSEVAIRELVDSGVLFEVDDRIRFFRTAFRDFFAAHHLRGQPDRFDKFFEEHLFDRSWGQVLVFAAGLRRQNSELLLRLNEIVSKERDQFSVSDGEDYLYGAYILGRLLSNSDYSDKSPRLEVLRTTVSAARESADLLAIEAVEQFGTIGNVLALLGVEHTLFVAVGVPWLEQQIRQLADESSLSEEERYLFSSLHAHLACDDWIDVFHTVLRQAKSGRVLAALVISANILDARKLDKADAKKWADVKRALARKRKKNKELVDQALELRNRLLEIEKKRLVRLTRKTEAEERRAKDKRRG